jgi:opacity protein-like surface antigen
MFRTFRPALVRAAAVAPLLAVCAAAAGAQAAAARPIGIAVSGGANLLQGEFSEVYATGYIIGGHVSFVPPGSPLGFRGDVNYQRNGLKSEFKDEASSNLDVISGFANAVFTVPTTASPVRPYALAGLGVGRIKVSASDDEFSGSVSQNKVGFQIGGGIDLPLSGIGAFIEAAYQRYSIDGGAVGLIPVRVGIRF